MFFEIPKDAGEKVGDGTVTPESVLNQLKKIGLVAEDVKIEIKDGEAKLTGEAESKEELEKIAVGVGNIFGINKVDATGAVALSGDGGSDSKFHVVERGDTLWAIAQKTLGDGNKYNAIFEANRPMLSDPNKIYPGQVLRIPEA